MGLSEWGLGLAKRKVAASSSRPLEATGESEKLYDPSNIRFPAMARDAARADGHIDSASAMMSWALRLGARIAGARAESSRRGVRSAILGGHREFAMTRRRPRRECATAMEEPTLVDVTDPVGRTFAPLPITTRSDGMALAACLARLARPDGPGGGCCPSPCGSDRGREVEEARDRRRRLENHFRDSEVDRTIPQTANTPSSGRRQGYKAG